MQEVMFGKLYELCHETNHYTWNVVSLVEIRWPGTGEFCTEEGHNIWYIGEEHEREECIIHCT